MRGSARCSRGCWRRFSIRARGRRNRRRLWVGILLAIVLSVAARGRAVGRAEDAALRQQIGVPGRRRHAGRHAGREHGRGAARDGRLPRHRSRSDRLPGLCRHCDADQLQRSRAPVLPAPGAGERRPAGEPRRTSTSATARATKSRARCGRSSSASPRRYGARVKVVEVPPGPPVLSPLVAEVYGPDEAGRHAVAKRVRAEFGRARRHRRRRRLDRGQRAEDRRAHRPGARRLAGRRAGRRRRGDARGARRRGRHDRCATAQAKYGVPVRAHAARRSGRRSSTRCWR